MPTALTPAVARTAIQKPVGSDVFSLAAINSMAQSIADRAEWAAKGLVAAQAKVVTIAGDDYPGATSYATVSDDGINANFALSVSTGDIVMLFSTGNIVGDTDTREYFLEWHDGTDQLVEQYFRIDNGTQQTFSVNTVHIVSSPGSKTFSLRGKRGASAVVVQGNSNLSVQCLHIKLGAA